MRRNCRGFRCRGRPSRPMRSPAAGRPRRGDARRPPADRPADDRRRLADPVLRGAGDRRGGAVGRSCQRRRHRARGRDRGDHHPGAGAVPHRSFLRAGGARRPHPMGRRPQPLARGPAGPPRPKGGHAMADIALEARGVSKGFPGVQALQGVSLGSPRVDPRAARRERRRQIDADQDHHGGLSA